MKKGKQYVTQLSQSDLAEIADAANMRAGDGITVTRKEDGIEIGIDRASLRMWVQHIIAGGQI